MNIIVPIKVLADDQDIVVAADRSLDDSKAHRIVSTYDLNAIEAAVQLASAHADSKVVCVSVADAKADDSKLKKGILARGVDELVMIADDACADLDAHATAAMLARLVDGLDAADLIVCGDGSADNYAQQVDVQLADALGLPVVTAVSAVSVEGAVATCDRMLETQLQTVQVDLPAVISAAPHPRHEGHPRRRQEAVLRERRFRCGGRGRRRRGDQGAAAGRAQDGNAGRLGRRRSGEIRGRPQSGPVGKVMWT